jgi:hypothetical protein
MFFRAKRDAATRQSHCSMLYRRATPTGDRTLIGFLLVHVGSLGHDHLGLDPLSAAARFAEEAGHEAVAVRRLEPEHGAGR